MTLSELIMKNAADVDAALPKYFETPEEALEVLYDAMRYSALSGGKRIRPFLVTEFCKLFGGKAEAAMPFACAIECVHASSLIHDDLPCMDNDELRRGKPTNHMVYGEDIALLAGDALMTRGYEIAANNADVDDTVALLATRKILFASGAVGMMGGQQIDLKSENVQIDFDTLLKMHAKKTGALIRVSAELGCLAAGITDENDPRMQAACNYANGIGLAFQIVDDILDATGDVATLGKMTHADDALGKTTFLTFMTVEEAQNYAKEITEKAIEGIKAYENSEMLIEFAKYLLHRTK
jgi:geranylgeranyl diphosphate synthase type II